MADLTDVCVLGAGFSSVRLHTTGLTPIASLHCYVCTCGENLQPRKCTLTAKAPTAAVGPDPALSPVTGLHHGVHLPLAPSAVHVYPAGLTLITSLHCCARACGEILQPQECTLTVRAPAAAIMHMQLALILAAGQGPCHCVCVHQLLTLHWHLQLGPAAEGAHTTCSSHHCCRPWSPAAGPGRAAEDPNSPCSHCEPPQNSPDTTQV